MPIGGFEINPAYALVKSSLVFVLVEGGWLATLKFFSPVLTFQSVLVDISKSSFTTKLNL